MCGCALEAGSDLLENCVPGIVTERVVNLVEPVDVEQQKDAASRTVQHRREELAKAVEVGKVGEAVSRRSSAKTLDEPALFKSSGKLVGRCLQQANISLIKVSGVAGSIASGEHSERTIGCRDR